MTNFHYNIQNERQSLIKTIMDIINDPSKLSKVANSSYSHTLGFDKIVIKENNKTGEKLRLHIWWPEGPLSDDNIHPHRWSFNSIILIGELENKIYEEHPQGKLFYEYIYTPPLKNENYKLIYSGTKTMILKKKVLYNVGDNYYQHYSIAHRSRRRSNLVVTLFAQGPCMTDFTRILTKSSTYDKIQEIGATRLTEPYIRNALLFLYNIFSGKNPETFLSNTKNQ